jgi:hypothetical protein
LEENGNLISFGANDLGQVGVKNSFDEVDVRSPVSIFQVMKMKENRN